MTGTQGTCYECGTGTEDGTNLRVLVDELGDVVHLVVDHDVEVLLGVVLGNILVGELGGHLDGVVGFLFGQVVDSISTVSDNRLTGQERTQFGPLRAS